MCGRFTLHTSPSLLAELFDLPAEPYLAPRYNIAPTQPVAIVRTHGPDAGREWALVQWGLIPSWSKDPSIGARLINARSETVEEKPSFRAAFRRRRCLIPTDGFYEWQRLDNKRKQPFYITLEEGEPFAFAGLWESWVGPDGSALDSCTILTTVANPVMEPIHDRMPVIVAPEDYADWLGTGGETPKDQLGDLVDLLRPYPAELMTARPIGSYVNSPFNEGVECIAPFDAQ